MGELTYIFVEGDAWYSKLIKEVEHGQYTHVAGLILGSTLEAQGVCDEQDRYPGVWLHSPTKYVDGVNCKFVTVKINDMNAAEEKARELLGCLYSFHGCIETGIESLFNLPLPSDGEKTVMCSEAWTRITQAGGPIGFTLPEFKADFVAPQRFYDSVIVGAI
jgi:hypothetical protein